MHQRLDSIDCLRGVAIAMVVLVHCGQAVTGLPDWLQQACDYGGRGVQLFFILSALTLFLVYREAPLHVGQFYLRRFFRIAPMFYLAMLVYALHPLSGTPPIMHDILLTAFFLHGFSISAINNVVPGGWTIADEMMFYALFSLALRYLTNLKRSVVALFVAIAISRVSFVMLPIWLVDIAPADAVNQFAAFCFPTQLPAFAGGIVLYYGLGWIREKKEILSKKLAIYGVIAAFAAIIACAVSDDARLHNYMFADALLMLLVFACELAPTRLLLNVVLRHLGRVSYSVYLVHFLVLEVAVSTLHDAINDVSPPGQLVVIYLTTLVFSVALATVTWRWIEVPMIAFGRRISLRYGVAAAS